MWVVTWGKMVRGFWWLAWLEFQGLGISGTGNVEGWESQGLGAMGAGWGGGVGRLFSIK